MHTSVYKGYDTKHELFTILYLKRVPSVCDIILLVIRYLDPVLRVCNPTITDVLGGDEALQTVI